MNLDDDRKTTALGWAAAFGTVLIGAGWQLATRAGARSALAPIDLALLRYLIPALLLAPLWWRTGLRPAGVTPGRLACMAGGAGLPFGLLAMGGASLAPAAHMGALLPGASPVLVALLGWAWLGTRPRRGQVAGLALLVAGLALITLPAWQGGAAWWRGDLLFLAAATVWTVYVLALRGSALGPWQVTALVSAWSALGVLPLWAWAWLSGRSLMASAGAGHVAFQALTQGLLAGIVGMAVFGVAVKHAGPTVTSSVGALVPAAVAVGGWLLLGEPLPPSGWAGVAIVVAGVWLASRPRPA